MAVGDLVDIIVAPGVAVTDEFTQQTAAVLGLDLYHTRRLLTAKVPRIVARRPGPSEAETLVRRLGDLGLVAFACPEAELREPLRVFRARSLTFEEGAAVFRDKDTSKFRLSSAGAFLIIDGIRHNRQQQEVVRKSKRLNLTGMLLTGGIPMKKTVEERTYETTVRDERIVRLFTGDAADSCIEVSQRGFDFSCLGPDMAPSSRHNIILLAAKFREFFPAAIFDDSLAVPFRQTPAPVAQRESFDLDCRLIYRYRALSR